ncbi:MAG: hypothetical protein AAF384_04400 [Pseudomonadota bacterium]
MSFLANASLRDSFVAALNANEEFSTQTRAFDGAIQIEVDEDCMWMKVYKGQVIDHEDAPSRFGYTFKLSGPEDAWQKLLSGQRKWADLTFPGTRYFDNDPELSTVGEMTCDIATEGNMIEAGRMTEAVFQLAYTLKSVAA